ncbi:MAG TPA: hypothetical protein VIR03_02025 [Candidatus Saccharimonadales bacterium]
MNRLSERGAVNVLLIPLILLVLFFFGALGFGFWAFAQRSHYKNDSDQISATAVSKAVATQKQTDAAAYAEAAKKPLVSYIGPSTFGNITVNYPKTWSGYVIENDAGGNPISAYFQPGVVPSVTDITKSFALRVELVQTPYDTLLGQFKTSLQAGKVTVTPYTLPKVPSVVGSRVEGQITPTKQGIMVILPLRNMTLRIWTESNDFKSDLDTNILPNLSFVP